MKPILAITMGDPAGIGPEIVVKALAAPRLWRACRPVVVGRLPVMETAARALGVDIAFTPVDAASASVDGSRCLLVETGPEESRRRAGIRSRCRSRAPRLP